MKPPAPEVFVPTFAAWPAALRRPALAASGRNEMASQSIGPGRANLHHGQSECSGAGYWDRRADGDRPCGGGGECSNGQLWPGLGSVVRVWAAADDDKGETAASAYTPTRQR